MKERNDIDDTTQLLLSQMDSHQTQFKAQMADLEKQKFTWIFQVVTIASAILGGFMLTKTDRIIVEDIALTTLFLCIFLALFFIYFYNKRMMEEPSKDSLRYHLRLISAMKIHELSKKDNLTGKDKTELKKYRGFERKVHHFIGEGIKQVSKEMETKLKEEKKSGPYMNISLILLVGVGLSILVLILADYLV